MTIGIVGLGLMGGSFALALKDAYQDSVTIVGTDHNISHLQEAQKLKLIDKSLSYDEIKKISDVIVFAIPVKAINLKKVKLKDIKKELEKYNNLGIKLTASLRTNPFKSGSNFYLFLVNKVGGFDKIKTSELLDFLYTKKHPLIQINFANSFYDVVRVEILGKKGVIEKTYGILTTHPLLHGLYLDELKEEILIKKYVKRRGIPIPKLERII